MKRCNGCMETYSDELHICPHCGFIEGTKPENALHMLPGSILANRYIVGKVIGYGGFGVTYIGWDTLLETKVAIKEYLPSEFSTRVLEQTQVTVFSGDKREQFFDGMRRFIEEAKKLAKFHSTPGIVKIFDSFESNNTAYIIMELLEGETLAEKLKRGEIIPEDKAIEMMIPVIQSLDMVHREGIIHRDIAPDNIFITKSGNVKLIDFGAARYATTTHSRSLTVIIKPGYSPEEQYRSRGDQGAYTDVYALAATMYRMITGQTPPDALERRAFYENKKKDILEPIRKYRKNIDEDKENAILNALNVRIEDRTPDMATFLYELTTNEPVVRKAGKIQTLDVFSWPLWAKIAIPSAAAIIVVFGILLAMGVFAVNIQTDIEIPDGYTRVPNVISLDYSEGEARLTNENLKIAIGGKGSSDRIDEDLILTQDINVGSIVPENTTVKVKINSHKILQQVPDVLGLDFHTAIGKLEELGFTVVKNEEYSNVIAQGCVMYQSASPFSEIDDHSEITLTESKGTNPSEETKVKDVEIPNFVGMSYSEAIEEAQNLGIHIKVNNYEYNKDQPRDTVLTQSVGEKETISNSETIEFTVSLGFEKVKVPDEAFVTEDDAKRHFLGRGLKCNIVYEANDSVTEGYVISHDPEAGSEVDPESVITIKVSTGAAAFQMPDVVGKNQTDAENTLKSLGLVVQTVFEENDSVPEGEVLRQSVSSGTDVHSGDEITITVCTHSAVIQVPDVVGKSQSDAEKLIKSAGLKVTVSKVNSDTVAKGVVISQSPKAGSGLKKNDIVVLNVSDGKASGTSSTVSTSSDQRTASNTTGNNNSNTNNNSNNNNNNNNNNNSNTTTSNDSTSKSTASKDTTSDSTSSKDSKTSSRTTTSQESETIIRTTVTLNKTTLDLTQGTSEQLIAQVSPSNAKVTWKSSNESVATVDNNGNVNGIAVGSAKITVSANGVSAACNVTVSLPKNVDPTSIEIRPSSLVLAKGESQKLDIVIKPDNASKNYNLSIDNSFVASISSDGTVTAISGGEATVTARTSNGKAATCKVVVYYGDYLRENGSELLGSGNFGMNENNVTWQLFNSGNMYVFGSGEMSDNGFNDSTVMNNTRNIIIENGVSTIGSYAFSNFSNLQSVTIPDSVRSIKDEAFRSCTSLSSVNIPDSVTELGSSVFEDCQNLTKVTLSNNISAIRERTFANCSNLSSDMNIPASVNSIDDYAFSNCRNIKKLYFYGDIPSFNGSSIFENCNLDIIYNITNDTWSNVSEEKSFDGVRFVGIDLNS